MLLTGQAPSRGIPAYCFLSGHPTPLLLRSFVRSIAHSCLGVYPGTGHAKISSAKDGAIVFASCIPPHKYECTDVFDAPIIMINMIVESSHLVFTLLLF
jgi:hypothetical protein